MSAFNKTVVTSCFDKVINGHDWSESEDLVNDVVDHSVRPGLLARLECNRQLAEMYFTAFPDLTVTIDDQVAEGDKVVTRWTARGTHQGELSGGVPPVPSLIGLHAVPPSGKEMKISGIAIDRLSEGKIIEHFGIHDSLAMMQKTGALPTTDR